MKPLFLVHALDAASAADVLLNTFQPIALIVIGNAYVPLEAAEVDARLHLHLNADMNGGHLGLYGAEIVRQFVRRQSETGVNTLYLVADDLQDTRLGALVKYFKETLGLDVVAEDTCVDEASFASLNKVTADRPFLLAA